MYFEIFKEKLLMCGLFKRIYEIVDFVAES